MLGLTSPTHWIIVIAVLVLLFGRGKISGLMADVAKGVRELRHIGDETEDAKRIADATAKDIQKELLR